MKIEDIRRKMKAEDIMASKINAVKVLREHGQFATANDTELAFAALICLEQFRWERDIAVSQLEELGLSLGQKIDGVYLDKEEYEAMAKLIKCRFMR